MHSFESVGYKSVDQSIMGGAVRIAPSKLCNSVALQRLVPLAQGVASSNSILHCEPPQRSQLRANVISIPFAAITTRLKTKSTSTIFSSRIRQIKLVIYLQGGQKSRKYRLDLSSSYNSVSISKSLHCEIDKNPSMNWLTS